MLKERPRVGKILRSEYTDLLVIIGPNVREVLEDYEDLYHRYPEVLLGYRVLLVTGHDVRMGALHGRGEVAKIIVLDGTEADYSWRWVMDEVDHHAAMGAQVENWYVHRVRGIWRIS